MKLNLMHIRKTITALAVAGLGLGGCETFQENPGAFCGGICAVAALATADTTGVDNAEDPIEGRRRENFNIQLKKACGGDKAAQYLIAQYYDRGEGTKRDKVEALKWYSLVEEEWPEAIKYFQDELRQEMTSSEIAEAERLAAEWVPNREDCDR